MNYLMNKSDFRKELSESRMQYIAIFFYDSFTVNNFVGSCSQYVEAAAKNSNMREPRSVE